MSGLDFVFADPGLLEALPGLLSLNEEFLEMDLDLELSVVPVAPVNQVKCRVFRCL